MTPHPDEGPGPTRRCVVLFARPPRQEARLKRIGRASPLFAIAAQEIALAVALLPRVDLLVCSDAPRRQGRGLGRSLPQRGMDFGERLLNAFHDARAMGYAEIIVVGADSPGLGERHLAAAFDSLARHDVVLGPSADGGAYLIGVRARFETLLLGVPWKTPAVCGRLLRNADDAVLLTEQLRDIDCAADLLEPFATTPDCLP